MDNKINEELLKLESQLNDLKPAVEHIRRAETISSNLVNSFSDTIKGFGNILDSVKKDLENEIGDYQKQLEIHASRIDVEINSKLKKAEEKGKALFNSLESSISKFNDEIEIIKNDLKKGIDSIQKKSETLVVQVNEKSKMVFSKLDTSTEVFNEKLEKAINNFSLDTKITIKELNKIGNDFSETTNKQNNEFNTLMEKVKKTASDMGEFVKEVNDIHLTIRLDKLDANLAGIIQAVQNTSSRLETVEKNIKESISSINSGMSKRFDNQSQEILNISNYVKKNRDTLGSLLNNDKFVKVLLITNFVLVIIIIVKLFL